MRKVLIGMAAATLAAAALIANAGSVQLPAAGASDKELSVATFAGGCFWCVESGFEHVPGVVDAIHRAGRAWRHKQRRTAIQKRGMQRDWSWQRPAQRHIDLYEEIRAQA